jgi:hypothetical protein
MNDRQYHHDAFVVAKPQCVSSTWSRSRRMLDLLIEHAEKKAAK